MLPSVILLALASVTTAHAGTRIVVREGSRRVVAISPHGGKPQTLVHLHRGAVLSTAVSQRRFRAAPTSSSSSGRLSADERCG
jgi:hypothetical protein